ncbi:hypothetical protein QR680_002530 [Steinernema hermaphroditum]|uniref:Cytoplasmic tRNA 2-thiolation protein 1 n=1 Tax=Steinernema hermaphroditum TaxID=289476 RepID=A0AA39LII5_9BILA|nr:hypothetical protein QR680_002530 [Steinernema hermaphroditum]
MKCYQCGERASVKCAKTNEPTCVACFVKWFEEDVHKTILTCSIFKHGERVAIGASGGKDSTVLAYVLNKLNRDYDYGLDLLLLSIDEGITGYRDDSLKAVERNEVEYGIPLTIVSYKDLYGWTMDEIVSKIGKKNNCTFCGVFRRQALDRGAFKLGAAKIVTGHNADDMAETILLNVLRGDVGRLQRCTNAITGADGTLPRAKPLKYSYEKDIVMYAHFKKLDYFCTECIYAPNAYRNNARVYVKDLERVRPQVILDLIRSGESLAIRSEVEMPQVSNCTRCGYISSQAVCKACLLLEGLNTNDLTLGISKKRKQKNKPEEKLIINEAEKPEERSGCSSGGNCGCDSNGVVVDF